VSTVVGSVLWTADPPLGDHNPPPGWDENETSGEFVVEGNGRATFRADSGGIAHFRRARPGESDPNAGCE
jgi:hypothetical protein